MASRIEQFHRFHSYSARFPSEIAERAIRQFSRPGESVFDPFCGSGTTLVAGLAENRRVVGTDIDTLAGMISTLKCEPRSLERYEKWCASFLKRLDACLSDIRTQWDCPDRPNPGTNWGIGEIQLNVPDFENIAYWFPPQVIAALAGISDLAHKCKDVHYEKLVLVTLSACIVAKWPNTLSYAKDVDHTRPHRKVQKITLKRVRDTFAKRLARCIQCLGGLHKIYNDTGVESSEESRVICPHDARISAPQIEDGSQTLIVTSPPYFNAVDYPRAHRLSVCWMNGHAPEELVSRRKYIGLRGAPAFDHAEWLKANRVRHLPKAVKGDAFLAKRVCAFFADLDDVLHECWRVLRPGGRALFVIANNVIKAERLRSHQILSDLAIAVGFEHISSNQRAIKAARRRFPVGPFGFDGPMTHEYEVLLRKPDSVV